MLPKSFPRKFILKIKFIYQMILGRIMFQKLFHLPRTILDRTISWKYLVLKTIPQFCFQIFSGKFLFLFSSRERFLDTMFQNWNPLRKSTRNPFWWWMGWVLLIIYFLPNIACYKCILLQYGFLHLIICNPKRCPKNDKKDDFLAFV